MQWKGTFFVLSLSVIFGCFIAVSTRICKSVYKKFIVFAYFKSYPISHFLLMIVYMKCAIINYKYTFHLLSCLK